MSDELRANIVKKMGYDPALERPDYPDETKGSRMARELRAKCNALTEEEREYHFNKGLEIAMSSKTSPQWSAEMSRRLDTALDANDMAEVRKIQDEIMFGNRAEHLSCGMDNVDAQRLGEAVKKAQGQQYGDMIDLGLILRRLLEEKGYGVVKLPAFDHTP